jgi:hypothetical protein
VRASSRDGAISPAFSADQSPKERERNEKEGRRRRRTRITRENEKERDGSPTYSHFKEKFSSEGDLASRLKLA